MKIMTLIKKLQEIEQKHGNVDVDSFTKSGSATLNVEKARSRLDDGVKVFIGPKYQMGVASMNWV